MLKFVELKDRVGVEITSARLEGERNLKMRLSAALKKRGKKETKERLPPLEKNDLIDSLTLYFKKGVQTITPFTPFLELESDSSFTLTQIIEVAEEYFSVKEENFTLYPYTINIIWTSLPSLSLEKRIRFGLLGEAIRWHIVACDIFTQVSLVKRALPDVCSLGLVDFDLGSLTNEAVEILAEQWAIGEYSIFLAAHFCLLAKGISLKTARKVEQKVSDFLTKEGRFPDNFYYK